MGRGQDVVVTVPYDDLAWRPVDADANASSAAPLSASRSRSKTRGDSLLPLDERMLDAAFLRFLLDRQPPH
jgi:hypothetical protein